MNGWILWKERVKAMSNKHNERAVNIVKRTKCSKCAHREFCNAGTKDCNSFVPRSEVAEANDQRAFYERMRREYREAWNDYAMND